MSVTFIISHIHAAVHFPQNKQQHCHLHMKQLLREKNILFIHIFKEFWAHLRPVNLFNSTILWAFTQTSMPSSCSLLVFMSVRELKTQLSLSLMESPFLYVIYQVRDALFVEWEKRKGDYCWFHLSKQEHVNMVSVSLVTFANHVTSFTL